MFNKKIVSPKKIAKFFQDVASWKPTGKFWPDILKTDGKILTEILRRNFLMKTLQTWDPDNWKVTHAATCSSDRVWVVKHANRWGILKIEKLQGLFEPGGWSKQGKQVGVLKIEKQQMQIVDPSKPCKYREGTRNEHHKWNRWPWVHPRKGICFVGSWSWVPALQFCWVLFLQTHSSFKGFKGLQNLFKVKSEAM